MIERQYVKGVTCLALAGVMVLACAGADSRAGTLARHSCEVSDKSVRPTIIIPAPTTRPALPQPDAEAQAKALKLVKEAFGDAYASKAPAERRALARKLLQQGVDTHDNLAARFVLLRDARDIAASAGDAGTAINAITQLERSFHVPALPMLLNAVTIAQRNCDSPEANTAAAHAALLGLERAVMAEEFSSAPLFLTVARAGAAKSQQVALVAQVQNRERELNALFTEHHRVDSARQTIRSMPNDPYACTVMGKYLCFSKGDWAAGLPLLTRCDQESLRNLAAAELASGGDSTKRAAAANGWWDMAQTRTGLMRKHLRDRAAGHYRRIIDDSKGISHTIALGRLREAELEAMRDLNFAPGLLAELFKGAEMGEAPLKVRVDPQIYFDWQEDAADEALTKDNFAIRWSGILKPPVAGRYELIIVANMGVRVQIGGQLVCDEADLSRKRNGVKVSVEMPQGLHPIVVEYWDKTGKAEMQLRWQRPGSLTEEAIPASAFFHDLNLEP